MVSINVQDIKNNHQYNKLIKIMVLKGSAIYQ